MKDAITFDKAIDLYRMRFKSLPTVVGLVGVSQDRARDALVAAVKEGEMFPNDAAFYRAIGISAPKGGVV